MLLTNETFKPNKAETVKVSDTTMLNKISTAGYKIITILFSVLLLGFYCTAPWLKKGVNEIIVFDLLQQEAKEIKGMRVLE